MRERERERERLTSHNPGIVEALGLAETAAEA